MKRTRKTQKAPGKSNRTGLSITELTLMFPDNETAERWFTEQRWPNGACCPACGSVNVHERTSRKPQPYRCRDCRKDFSVKTGTLMHSSNLGYRVWAIAIYLSLTSLKSVSSMKLHRDLNVTQKTAWHLMHRIRENWQDKIEQFTGPVEVDETYFGGKRRNMSKSRREQLEGRGATGKTAVVGAKDRASKKVSARVVKSTDKKTLQGFVKQRTQSGAKVYTDEAIAYHGLPFDHATVRHSLQEYVKGDVHTNGIESLWSMLKRAHKGTFHKLSPKHLDRYIREFAGRHNIREMDTIAQMGLVVRSMDQKQLRYSDLIADNGLDSGARA